MKAATIRNASWAKRGRRAAPTRASQPMPRQDSASSTATTALTWLTVGDHCAVLLRISQSEPVVDRPGLR